MAGARSGLALSTRGSGASSDSKRDNLSTPVILAIFQGEIWNRNDTCGQTRDTFFQILNYLNLNLNHQLPQQNKDDERDKTLLTLTEERRTEKNATAATPPTEMVTQMA